MAVNRINSPQAEASDSASARFANFDSVLDAGDNNSAFNADVATKSKDTDAATPDDGFDPFQIGPTAKTRSRSSLSRLFRSSGSASSSKGSISKGSSSRGSVLLPPRLDVKFKIHEEVSSGPSVTNLNEGACDVYVVGTVYAQQTSSDALKNAPFVLGPSSTAGTKLEFSPNETYTKVYATQGQQGKINVIKIPKTTVGYVAVGKYTISETVDHMPLLLEKKISKVGNKVHMAFQVRSKLTNRDDLGEFSLAVAMDENVVGDSVAITSGTGDWDRGKRAIVWKLDSLPKGESFMVTANARVASGEVLSSEDLKFPAMLRCKSQDQISTARFQAIEASGYPATISCTTVAQSFSLIHRLN